MFAFFWNLLSFVIALGILVAVHEWGHYYIARRCGVKVLRFSIGFGKPIYQKITSSGMEFVIAAIPLGGYVRMLDGRVDHVEDNEKHLAFDSQAVWKRFAIVAAGPGINFVFAAFVLMIMLMIGTQYAKPIVGEILPNSYLSQTDIDSGEQIIKVGGNSTQDWQAVNLELMSFIGKDQIQLTTQTPSGRVVEHKFATQGWNFDPDSQSIFSAIGLRPYSPAPTTTLFAIAPDSAASRAGLEANDEIVKLDGTLIEEWGQIVKYVEARPYETIEIEVLRDGNLISISATIDSREKTNERAAVQSQGFLGVVPLTESWPEQYVDNNRVGPVDAMFQGVQRTWRLMTLSVEMLGKFITGDVSVKNLSGPISIAQGAGNSASYGVVAFLGFLALISVNLGIVNLLPLPMLDGGHLMYFTYEWLTGKPVSEAVQEVGFRIGGVLLFMLMATAIFNDILRIT